MSRKQGGRTQIQSVESAPIPFDVTPPPTMMPAKVMCSMRA